MLIKHFILSFRITHNLNKCLGVYNNNNPNNNNIIIIGYVWQDLRRKTTSVPVSPGFENLSSMSQNIFFFFLFFYLIFFFFFFSVGSYWKGPALTLHDLVMVIN